MTNYDDIRLVRDVILRGLIVVAALLLAIFLPECSGGP